MRLNSDIDGDQAILFQSLLHHLTEAREVTYIIKQNWYPHKVTILGLSIISRMLYL